MEFLIRTYTNPGQLVFDPYMGSGSTGIAALRCGRRFVGVEQDDEYFHQTVLRFEPQVLMV